MPTAYMQYSPIGLLSSIKKDKELKSREYKKGEGKLHRKMIYLEVEKLLNKKQKYQITILNL